LWLKIGARYYWSSQITLRRPRCAHMHATSTSGKPHGAVKAKGFPNMGFLTIAAARPANSDGLQRRARKGTSTDLGNNAIVGVWTRPSATAHTRIP
jgi:hypothetical protein